MIIQIINMKKNFLIISLVFFSFSCSTWKNELAQKGNYEIAIKNAVLDFCHTSTLAKKDKTFSLSYKEYETGIIGISILGDTNKIYVINGSSQRRIQDQYVEYDNKLFYWYDSKKNSNIVKKLSEYKVIDSVKVLQEDMGYVIDDKKDGINYYFCKDNLLIYKKEQTSTAMPKTITNNLNCTQIILK